MSDGLETTFRTYLVSNPPNSVGDVVVTIMDPMVNPESIRDLFKELHSDTLVSIKRMGMLLTAMCEKEISKRGT